ncbi:MarR family transcriptional regulator [Rubrivivax gelatinosus]|uniref:MarR family winged helix-turn-helix transcriptional regulator n=1 Tax=Rubrivivax gelatinosus TaxID=28068 RepID=UPI00217973AE|nr:MarR family transcriptional regulator [Rubrivivax gelatinosus]
MNTPPDVADESLKLDRQLCFPLYAAGHAIVRAYRPLLEPLGLTYPQYLVMLVLWESAPCTVGEIGTRLALDSGTLTPLLKRLAGAGLVGRERDRGDERRVLIRLTDAGAALKLRARAVPAALACRLAPDRGQIERLQQELRELIVRLDPAHDAAA